VTLKLPNVVFIFYFFVYICVNYSIICINVLVATGIKLSMHVKRCFLAGTLNNSLDYRTNGLYRTVGLMGY